MACNPENGSGGISHLAGLQCRQAGSGNFQKRDKIQCNFNLHIPSHPEQHESIYMIYNTQNLTPLTWIKASLE